MSDPLKQQKHDAIEHDAIRENVLFLRQQEHKKCVEYIEIAK